MRVSKESIEVSRESVEVSRESVEVRWGSEKVPGQLQLCVLHCWGVLFKRGRHSFGHGFDLQSMSSFSLKFEIPIMTELLWCGFEVA